jgi:hypothetical protein
MPGLSFRAIGVALLLSAAIPEVASAQTSVIVVGIRSVEGDDEFSRNLTGALRHAASSVDGWNVSDREVTLSQLALAHGCEEPDPPCLAQMADSLEVQRIIYGEVRRTSGGQTYDFSLDLHLFNSGTDQIEHSVTDTIPSVHRDIDDLRDVVRRYIAQLSGAPRVGTLQVRVNVPGAEVFVDDVSVGTSDAEGRLVVNDVQSGSRRVRVVAAGHQSFRATVSVEAYGQAEFEAELQTGGDGGGGSFPVNTVVGAGLLVVAAGLAAGWVGSWAYVQGLNGDEDFQDYRRRAGTLQQGIDGMGSSLNVCTRAQATDEWERHLYTSDMGDPVDGISYERTTRGREQVGRITTICDDAATFEVLQFVFGFGALGIGALGLYFLIAGITEGSPPSEQAWRVIPSVGADHVYLDVVHIF